MTRTLRSPHSFARTYAPTPIMRQGVSFLGLLTLVFVVAKLWAGSTMSWFVVFLPVLIPSALAISVIVAVLFAFGVACVIDYVKTRKRRNNAAKRIGGRAVFA